VAAPHVDMRGKTVMITGFTAGVGRASAFALAEMGADVVGVCRDADKGQRVLDEMGRAHEAVRLDMLVGDLGVQRDIRRIADEFLASDRPLHVLYNNAGVFNLSRTTTQDGYEATFAVNHLAYFLLTNLLLDRLCESAAPRVVCTASDGYKFGGRLDFDDLQAEKKYTAFPVYCRSKLANVLFTQELGRLAASRGLTAHSFHPGFVGSDLAKNNGRFARFATRLISPFARSPQKGGETGVYLCTAPAVREDTGGPDSNGAYFYNMKQQSLAANARYPEDAARLWDVSLELTGLSS
jgi:NAD(P)-dependent dehydrogenase (short-subunit alcohol dehydrogenase family)